MSIFAGTYFDGLTSEAHPASVMMRGGRMVVVGRDVDRSVDLRRVRVSQRVGDAPRWLYLPDGGAVAVGDNDAIDRIAQQSTLTRWLHQWESRPALAGAALVAIVALVAALFWFGVPAAADFVAQRIPQSVEARLGERTLAAMEGDWMRPSRLAAARQARLRARFGELLKADGDRGPVRLEFRDAPALGPNALALPGNIIVVTDQLVALAGNSSEVVGVLAHELGHLRQRHVMRGLLESSAVALVIAAITGDIAATSSLAAAAPAVLLQSKFSRDNESEADRFAIDLLRRAGVNPAHYAAMLARLRAQGKEGAQPPFLASHPPTVEREALARAAATGPISAKAAEAGSAAQPAGGAGGSAAAAAPKGVSTARSNVVEPALIVDARQRRIVELVRAGNVDALEAEVGALQAALERDSAAADALVTAYHAFAKLPDGALATLDAWVARHPRSHSALVARTRFNYTRAWTARGTGNADSTSRESWQRMAELFTLARADADAALALSQRPLLSHRYLMLMAQTDGDKVAAETNFQAALRIAPASVETHLAYLGALEPRWGGSLKRMDEFARASRASLAPRDADRLAAAVLKYESMRSVSDRQRPVALEKIEAALALHEDAESRCWRAQLQVERDQHAQALADLRRGLAIDAEEKTCLNLITNVVHHIDNPPLAVELLGTAVAYGRADAATLAQRGWNLDRMSRPVDALADYRKAAEMDHAWSQVKLAEMLYNGIGTTPDRAQALQWLDRAAAAGDERAIKLKAQLARAKPAAP